MEGIGKVVGANGDADETDRHRPRREPCVCATEYGKNPREGPRDDWQHVNCGRALHTGREEKLSGSTVEQVHPETRKAQRMTNFVRTLAEELAEVLPANTCTS